MKMSKKLFWLFLILANLLAASGAFRLFFSNRDFSENQKKNAYRVGVSYMTMNNEFYEIMNEEIAARIEAEGDQMILRDPALDEERQRDQISRMLKMGIDLLVVTPVNWESIVPLLEEAKAEGVKVVVLDTNVFNEELADCTITSDNYQAGVMVGEYFLESHDQARVIVMTHQAAKSGQDRVQGFLDTVEGRNGIEIVGEIECEGQLEIAMPRLQEAIREGEEFDSVFCLNDLASVGAVAALDADHLLDQVQVYGVDGSPDSKALIKEGMMEATAAQFPTKIGQEAAEVIYRLLEGETVEKNIIVPVELITRDNVDDYGISRWQ